MSAIYSGAFWNSAEVPEAKRRYTAALIAYRQFVQKPLVGSLMRANSKIPRQQEVKQAATDVKQRPGFQSRKNETIS